jgi:hypothetical protein
MGKSNIEADGNSSPHFFIDIVPQALAASKKIDALHEAAEAERRTGKSVQGTRLASVREIQQVMTAARDKTSGQPNPSLAAETVYDLSDQDGRTPNFRDLAKGSSSQRSQDFQTGRRVDYGGNIPDRKPKAKRHERRDSRGRPNGRY